MLYPAGLLCGRDHHKMNGRVCRRCLLRELDGAFFQSIYQYIENLPAEQKADPDEYRRRLSICRECESLQNGMCAQCGCFAEVRAAKRKMNCPIGAWEAKKT